MASLETIGPLMNGMKKRADTVGLACEALHRMFQKEQGELVAQVSALYAWFQESGHSRPTDVLGGGRMLWMLTRNFLSFFFFAFTLSFFVKITSFFLGSVHSFLVLDSC